MPDPKIMSVTFYLAAFALFGSQHVFGVNGKPILCVPESDMDPLLLSYADESTHLQAGSGHRPGFGVLFGAEIMKSIIPGYVVIPGFDGHDYANALSASVSFLGQGDIGWLGPAMRARAVEDEWYARVKCPQPIVTSVVDAKLYEVKCSAAADYSSIWNRAPDPQSTMPKPNEFVVATCQYKDIPSGPHRGVTIKDCARVFAVDQFLIDYRFQRENARAIPEIDSMILDKLSQWKRNCSSPA
jgi:hypothetical protein